VLDSSLCSACGEHEESTHHALWDYVAVQPIWGPKFNALRSDVHEFSSFLDLVCMIGQHQKIWSSSWFWLGSFGIEGIRIDSNSDVSLLIRFSRQHKHYSFEIQAKPSRQPPSAPLAGVKWKAPSQNFYKVNYDRAISLGN